MTFFRKAKETLFGMQFVMTDGPKQNNGNPMRSLMILFTIDVLQVFRVMLSPSYGWNLHTYNVAKHVDIVYNITWLLSLIVPRYVFFGLAFFLVAFALCDAFYCARLFKAGDIDQIGPIKVLRFMVAVVVTTLFSSIMKWLLIPLDCLISQETSFSTYFHGEGAPCTPWGFPEILFTVPTCITVFFYVVFAITVAYISLGTNPLSCAPRVQFTGRIEALYIVSKVCGTFLPFLSKYITPVAVSMILFGFCCAVLRRHLSVLPFHNLATNMLRGGIFTSIWSISFSSVLVSSLDALDILSPHTMQTLQWLLLGVTPVAFSLGVLLVWRRRSALSLAIDRLRGEFETLQTRAIRDSAGGRKTLRRGTSLQSEVMMGDNEDSADGGLWPDDALSTAGKSVAPKPRGALAVFFNPAWERTRAFPTAQAALNAIRTLLMQRSESTLPFLKYMLARAAEEHPDSQELQVLHVSLLRFVFCQTAESSQAEKKLRNSHTSLAVDYEYVLYAVKRKAAQDYAAVSIGNGVFNAINLMEFDSGMSNARTAHMTCIAELRKFWAVASSRKTKEPEAMQKSVDKLVEFNSCVERANMEYKALMEKYPQSTQLIAAYCSFCDTVLNDPTLANELRKKAAALHEDDADQDSEGGKDEALQVALEKKAERSATSGNGSDGDDHRVKIQKAFKSWSAEIFGDETKELKTVARRVRVWFALLFVCSVVGFAVMQFFLFESYARRDSHLINQTGLLRTLTITSIYHLRSQLLAAWRGDDETVAKLGAEMSDLAKRMQVQHWSNYELARTSRVTSFYTDASAHGIDINVPFASGWVVQRDSFWNFGSDWARRMDRASTATTEQLLSPDYDVSGGLPESKLNIVFLNENALRVGIPTLEKATLLYEDEMQNLWALTQTIAGASTAAAMLILTAILLLVLLRLTRTISALQHLYLASHVAATLPHATTRKIARFYKEAENAMRSIVDEDEMRRQVECETDSDDKKKLTHLGSESEVDCTASPQVNLNGGGRPGELGEGLNLHLGLDDSAMEMTPLAAQATRKGRDAGLAVEHTRSPGVMSLNEDNLSMWTTKFQPETPRRVSHWDMPVPVQASDPVALEPRQQRASSMLFNVGVIQPIPAIEHRMHCWPSKFGPTGTGSLNLNAGPGAEDAGEGPQSAMRVAAGEEGSQPEESRCVEASEEACASEASEGEAKSEAESEAESESMIEKLDPHHDREQEASAGAEGGWDAQGAEEEQQAEEEEEEGGEEGVEEGRRGRGRKGARASVTVAVCELESGPGPGASGRPGTPPPRARSPPPVARGGEESEGDEDDAPLSETEGGGEERGEAAEVGDHRDPDATGSANLKPRAGPAGPPAASGVPVERAAAGGSSLGNARSIRFQERGTIMGSFSGILKRSTRGSFRGKPNLMEGGSFVTRTPSGTDANLNPGPDEEGVMRVTSGGVEQSLLPLRAVPEERAAQIWACVRKHERFSARTAVWIVSLTIIIALSALLNWFPARRMSTLVTLAPTINQAGRRRTLTRACAHLTRELVIDDGFGRMRKAEVAGALHLYLEELRRVNNAVRLGGDLNIGVGADSRNADHNKIMYNAGCPWREDPSDCSYPKRPGVATKGLYHLSLSFMDAVQSVLDRYGPPPAEWSEEFLQNPRTEGLLDYNTVRANVTQITELLAEDPDVQFILDNFDGDLFTGYFSIVRLFDAELVDVIMMAMRDNQALFIVFILVTFGGVYVMLFAKAVREALEEGERARTFVARIPAHTFSPLEVDTLCFIFRGRRDTHDET